MGDLEITDLRLATATPEDVMRGHLVWLSCAVDNRLGRDGIAVRRRLDGRLALSFPARVDSAGRQHPIVRPVDDAVRREIEAQVFAALTLSRETPR